MKNVIQIMPEFGLAGAETMCESLVYELKNTKRYNLVVVSLYDYHSPITERLEKAGIEVVYLNKKKGADLSIIGRLVSLMKNKHIDIVHTHRYVMQYAIPAAVIAGVPIRIHTVHSVAEKEQNKPRRLLSKFFFKFCNVCPVAISPIVKETIIKEYRLKDDDVPMIFNGVDLTHCQPKTNYNTIDDFSFIHVGRMTELKQQKLIIEAIAALRTEGYRVKAILIGDGELRQYNEQLSKELGVDKHVVFCGLQSDIFPFLHNSDAFLLPSLYEGMPISLIEAMGTGLPIIASCVGGIPDMIESGTSGMLIKPNLNEIVDAMRVLIEDIDFRQKIGKNARARAQSFSALNMSNNYMSLYCGNKRLIKNDTTSLQK